MLFNFQGPLSFDKIALFSQRLLKYITFHPCCQPFFESFFASIGKFLFCAFPKQLSFLCSSAALVAV